MKNICFIGFGIAVVFSVFVLGFGQDSEMPAPDAAEVWKYITQISPYENWGFWKDHTDMQPGRAPHGPVHKVYVNKILQDAVGIPAPYGSIQVKESYNDQKKLVALTLMYKFKGYNPQAGDWYWAKFSVEGKAGPEGKVQGCIGCHRVKADNDYIIVHNLGRS